MAMEVTYIQKKDATRRVVTEDWEILFQPLNGSEETYGSMAHRVLEFKIFYFEKGNKACLGDARCGVGGVEFLHEDTEISKEIKMRLIACNKIIWQVEPLKRV